MKKLSAILLVSLYLVITSGFAVNVHYCMGKVSSVELESFGRAPCGSCGKKDAGNSCCRTSVKFFKVKTSHIATAVQHVFNPLQLVAIFRGDSRMAARSASSAIPPVRLHAAPPPGPQPLFILNDVFLI